MITTKHACTWVLIVFASFILFLTHAEEEAVSEDPDFDPHGEQEHENLGDNIDLEDLTKFDFDPSQGLTFVVNGYSKECFYEDVTFLEDSLSGAYLVSSADAHIDLEVKNPQGENILMRMGDAEAQYDIPAPLVSGVYEFCFVNTDSEGKLVTHVTQTLESQHPVKKEHINTLAKYASHIDIRLGEIESEQRLQQLRTDRFIKVERSTSKRLSRYGGLECIVYLVTCFLQVYYIKNLLGNSSRQRTWA